MKEIWSDSKTEGNKGVSFSHTPSITARTSFFYLQSAGHFYCSSSYYTRREGYKSYLLIYTISGKGYAKYRGRFYELVKDSVIIMDCYEYQEYYSDKQELWEIKWMHFNGNSSEEYFNMIYENYGPIINMQNGREVHDALNGIMQLCEEKDIQAEVKASRMIVQILTELILSASSISAIRRGKEHNSMVEEALDYIESNFSTRISLKDIAAAACSSSFHLCRIFKRVMGYSPYEYLIKYRINTAKALLKTTDRSVDEIAESVGYESTSNFIKAFGEVEGMTPLKYRKYWAG